MLLPSFVPGHLLSARHQPELAVLAGDPLTFATGVISEMFVLTFISAEVSEVEGEN